MKGFFFDKMLVPPIARGSGGNPWPSYWTTQGTTELIAYTAGLTTPLSSDQLYRLTDFVKALKTGLSITNLSDAFDVMYVLGGETSESSLRNLVDNAHHATLINSPSFNVYEGFTGNGVNSYIDTNYNALTEADNLSINNASYGCYLNNDIAGADAPEIGVAGTGNLHLYSSFTDNKMYIRIHSTTFDSFANTDRSGMFIGSRTASNVQVLYKDKGLNNGTKASAAIANLNVSFLRSGNTYSRNQIAFGFTGRGLTSGEVGVITDAFETYRTSCNAIAVAEYYDLFVGNDINENIWQIRNTNTALARFNQNNSLIMDSMAGNTTDLFANVITSKIPLEEGYCRFVFADLHWISLSINAREVGLKAPNNNRICFYRDTALSNVYFKIVFNSVVVYSVDIGIFDFGIFKISVIGNDISLYQWSAEAWVQLGVTVTQAGMGKLYFYLATRGSQELSQFAKTIVNELYVSHDAYTTLIPTL